jgi:hypothetical protein
MVHERGGGVCRGHRHLLGNSNDRGDRLMPVVGSDLQQFGFRSLEFSVVVYESSYAADCSDSGFTLGDDQ